MSFTLQHYKNGRPVAVKMSIWDAFKGVPDLKPRRHRVRPQSLSNVAFKPVHNPSFDHSVQCSGTLARRESVRGNELDGRPRTEIAVRQSDTDSSRKALKETGTQTSASKLDSATCPSCNVFHNPGDKSITKDSATSNSQGKAKKVDGNKQNSGGDAKANVHSTSDKEEYSAEDNVKIIDMKSENATWAKILEAIGKTSKSQLLAHWKTIDPAKQHAPVVNNDKKGTVQEDKEAQKKAKAEKNREEGLKKQAEKGKQNKGSEPQADSDKKPSGGKALKELVEKYDKQKWMSVASKHFDLTGQRITPAQARKMAERK